jgi:hypothetical protein
MRTFRKILVGMALAGALSLGIVWGDRAITTQHTVSAEMVHGELASEPVFIQKPGH